MSPAAPLATPHGELRRPAFLPDGTRGVVKTVDPADLAGAGVPALMVNALHLAEAPGASVIRAAGGIHAFMGWEHPIASDSGGYQVFSLMAPTPPLASVSERGFSYAFERTAKRRLLSPRRSIEQQLRIGADILFCLDHCTHPDSPWDVQRQSVDHTLAWAAEARKVFREMVEDRPPDQRPRLFAVVQGGENHDLRARCADGLVALGFDGYGFGGWPIDDRDGGLVAMVQTVAELVPPEAPKHGLGIGRPENVVAAWRVGYDMFDCTLPTRLGRRGRLYALTGDPLHTEPPASFYDQLEIGAERYRRDPRPVDADCDCHACTSHSRGYLAHLFSVGDPLGPRLGTIHNLRFYTRLLARLGDGAR